MEWDRIVNIVLSTTAYTYSFICTGRILHYIAAESLPSALETRDPATWPPEEYAATGRGEGRVSSRAMAVQ
jgi:hypothetical protein